MPQYTGTPAPASPLHCDADTGAYARRLFRARKYPSPCAPAVERLTLRGRTHELRFTGGACRWADRPDADRGSDLGRCATDADEQVVVVGAGDLRTGDVVAFVGADGTGVGLGLLTTGQRRYRLTSVRTTGDWVELRGDPVYNATVPAVVELRRGTAVAVVTPE